MYSRIPPMHPRIPPYIYIMFSVLRDLQVREEAGRGSSPTKTTITVYNKDPQEVDLYIGRGCIFSLFSSEKEKRKKNES